MSNRSQTTRAWHTEYFDVKVGLHWGPAISPSSSSSSADGWISVLVASLVSTRFHPGKLNIQTCSPNSETDPGNDLNHQGADHVFLDIGPAIRILQLNIEGISAAKREILSTICSSHQIDIICVQEVHAKADVSRGRLVIDNYDLVAFAGHWQHGRATYVRSDIADAELLDSATLFDIIRVGSYKITNVYKPPPTDWINAALPAHQHPAIYVGDFNSHHATWGYERADSNGE